MSTNPALPAVEPMLTIFEVAALIQKHPCTVRRLARQCALPGAKQIGNEWRFQRKVMVKFITGGRA